MSEYISIFYGNTEEPSFKISYLLISRNIRHDFVLIDDDCSFILKTNQRMREFFGFENIYAYLTNYKYIYDFPEIQTWKF